VNDDPILSNNILNPHAFLDRVFSTVNWHHYIPTVFNGSILMDH
jgi:hypothetical protein